MRGRRRVTIERARLLRDRDVRLFHVHEEIAQKKPECVTSYYRCNPIETCPSTCAAGMAEVAALLAEAIERFDRAGLRRERVSGGSTATLFESHRTPITELRPGNYALLDRAEAQGEFALADCALRVQATVVSASLPGRFVIDAGAKTLSEAGPPPCLAGYGAIVGHDELELVALSEEHGHGAAAGGEVALRVGDRVEVIPNHACTCVNLHDLLYGVRGGVVEAEMRVLARGAVR